MNTNCVRNGKKAETTDHGALTSSSVFFAAGLIPGLALAAMAMGINGDAQASSVFATALAPKQVQQAPAPQFRSASVPAGDILTP